MPVPGGLVHPGGASSGAALCPGAAATSAANATATMVEFSAWLPHGRVRGWENLLPSPPSSRNQRKPPQDPQSSFLTAKVGCPTSRWFFARCGIPLRLPSDSRFIRCTERSTPAVSHISRKTGDIGALGLREGTGRNRQSNLSHRPWRQLASPPQVPTRHRAPGLPPRRPPLHLLRLGQHIRCDRLTRLDPPEGQQVALADSIIRPRKDIRPPQAKDQQHLRRPRPDAAHLAQPLDDLPSGKRRIAPIDGTVPSRVLAARSRRERSLPRERPAARSLSSGTASNCSGCGCRSPNIASRRPRIARAALACSCWYRMASSSASNGEWVLFTCSANGPTRSISAPAWRPPSLIAAAQGHCRNEPGAGHRP